MKKVSCISLAGWCFGKLSAVKLCQSSSISGPSDNSNPTFEKISIIWFLIKVIGCKVPLEIGNPGLVKSSEILLVDFELTDFNSSYLIWAKFFNSFIFWPYSFFWSEGTFLNSLNRSLIIPFLPRNWIFKDSISSISFDLKFLIYEICSSSLPIILIF